MSRLDELLNNLKSMKNTVKKIFNTKEVWEAIGKRDWQSAGFGSEEEAQQWLENNDYQALS